MSSFPLRIVTLDGLIFDGEAEQLSVRTVAGEMGVLAGHINCISPLGMGRACVTVNGEKKYAACIGGVITILDGKVRLVPTTFEWAGDIDVERSRAVLAKAEAVLADKEADAAAIESAQAHIKRARVRLAVAELAK